MVRKPNLDIFLLVPRPKHTFRPGQFLTGLYACLRPPLLSLKTLISLPPLSRGLILGWMANSYPTTEDYNTGDEYNDSVRPHSILFFMQAIIFPLITILLY